ncbi:shikimate dehydrogenase [Desulfovibrio sp. OttesenSCG-928-G15]|nr:shikimate dehydrogenase [Desulfovibrio sp. OttesenSCG-928-G15]
MCVPQHMYGILGMPLGHSLSPFLHTWGFSLSGHAGVFVAWEKQQNELPAFFAAFRSLPIHGLCVTIPYKQAVIPFVDAVSAEAREAGAVNTLHWFNNTLVGHNTDIAGFMAPLAAEAGKGATLPETALVLGAGGAARAVLAGLNRLAFRRVYVCARNPEQAAILARDFGARTLGWEQRSAFAGETKALLLVNATPLGMAGANAGQSPLPEDVVKKMGEGQGADASLVYDIVYNPLETPLLAAAAKYGLRCWNGLSFFVAQASEQHALWTGHRLATDKAMSLLAEKLGCL